MHSKPQHSIRPAIVISLILVTVAAIASAPTEASTPVLPSSLTRQLGRPSQGLTVGPAVDAASAEARLRAEMRQRLAVRALLQEAIRRGPHSRLLPAGSAQGTSGAPSRGHADWDAIAYCESHGQWNINSGTFWGGLQFAHSTWFAFGGGRFSGVGWFPYSREQQISVAERVLASEGPGAWPVCFAWA